MTNIQIGIGITTLILFFIIIGIGYVYVNESRENAKQVNGTITKFIEQWDHKQAIDNIRFNKTLNSLNNTYHLIVDNQKLILNLSNLGSQSVQHNLNLTKFNRATLTDTNHKVTEIMKILNQTGK
jgi:6-pyruvoyl-tetrahydropterin synthase